MRVLPRRVRVLRGATVVAVATIAAATLLIDSSPLAQASIGTGVTVAAPVAAQTVMTAAVVTAPKAAPVKVIPRAVLPYKFGTKKYNLWYARNVAIHRYHWGWQQFVCLARMWGRESAWNQRAHNRSGAHGIPQAMPGRKMAKFGKDWRTNPNTQIRWGLHYVYVAYTSPCRAWSFWQYHHWY